MLHRCSSAEQGQDATFANSDFEGSLPSQRFPDSQMGPEDAFEGISAELLLDGNASQNLATFCQTWEDPRSTS